VKAFTRDERLAALVWFLYRVSAELHEERSKAILTARALAYAVGLLSPDGLVWDVPEWVFEPAESFGDFLAALSVHDVPDSDKVRFVTDQDWWTIRDLESSIRESVREEHPDKPRGFVLSADAKCTIDMGCGEDWASVVVIDHEDSETALIVYESGLIFDAYTGRRHVPPRFKLGRAAHFAMIAHLGL
jgi:hypothetical protein